MTDTTEPLTPDEVERCFSDAAIDVRERVEARRRIAALEAAEAQPA